MALSQSSELATVRQATVEDIPRIRDIARASWEVTYREILSPEQFEFDFAKGYEVAPLTQQLCEEGHTFFVLDAAECGVLGFASSSAWDENPEECYLHKLYLDPTHKGSGYGRLLLTPVLEAAKAAGFSAMTLTVNRKNKSVGFYERMGFTIREARDSCIGHDPLTQAPYWRNDYVMVYVL